MVPVSRKCAPADNCQTGNPDDAFNILAAKLQDGHYLPVSWIEGYFAEDVAALQRENTDISIVTTWVEKEENPTKSQLHLESPATRAFWLFREFLYIKNGVLYYEWIDKVDRRFCLVVPTCLKKTVFIFCHNTKSAGHLGQQKTCNRVKQSSTGIICHNIVQSMSKGVLPVIKIRSLILNL